MSAPLAGLRVLELGVMIAVPAATHILAGYGAEVIKIEEHTVGDTLRFFGSNRGGMSGWFVNANWGKRSLALDIKSVEGQKLLTQLIGSADVLVEGFRTGVMERLGFGYEAVCKIKPDIIYCSSSGYGPIGPYAGLPVYDPLIQALTGWAGVQKQEGKPTLVRAMVADKVGAYTNAQAIMAALIKKERTGEGSHVNVSMLEANLAFVWPDVMMDHTLLEGDATHLPNLLASYRLYECRDGQVAIAAGADHHWQAMCDALGPSYYEDERFHTAAGRGAHIAAWMDACDDMVTSYTVFEVVTKLRDADVPVAPVLAPEDVHTDTQIDSADMLPISDHAAVGRIRHPQPASVFFGERTRLMDAPRHGEHTIELMQELGLNKDVIEAYLKSGVVVQAEPL